MEDPEEAYKKVMSATTDSVGTINYDPENQPGIANLITIEALLNDRKIEEVANEVQGITHKSMDIHRCSSCNHRL